MTFRPFLLAAAAWASVALTACPEEPGGSTPTDTVNVDAAADGTLDGAADVLTETDVSSDTSPDTASDGGIDVPDFETVLDALPEIPPLDAIDDVPVETTPDAGPELPAQDVADEQAQDAAPELPTDTGFDASETAPDIVEDTVISPDASDVADSTDADTAEPVGPIDEDVRNYIFGHSLILHSATANVPRWLASMSEHAGMSYALSGQYGFADTHASNLPPFAQWGVPGVTPFWDDDSPLGFGDIDVDVVMFTEANFRQHYPPDVVDPDGFLSTSTLEDTVAVFDWVHAAEPSGVRYIIYENWPDMGGYTGADFETTFPSDSELDAYNTYTLGAFHDWWVAYQDVVAAARPELNVRMIPVGSIMAEMFEGPLSSIPAATLYEDNAPHGTPSLYFVAGTITYMGMYGVPAPEDFPIPADVDPAIAALYDQIVAFGWDALNAFNFPDGSSRVF